MNKRVLAVDPGSVESAWCIYQPGERNILNGFGKELNSEVVKRISTMTDHYDLCVVEMMTGFMGGYGNQTSIGKDVLNTCIAIGRFLQTAENSGKEALTMYRRAIATSVTGMAKPRDKDVRAALIKRFGEPGTIKSPGRLYGVTTDIWSALAVGVAFMDKQVQSAEHDRLASKFGGDQ